MGFGRQRRSRTGGSRRGGERSADVAGWCLFCHRARGSTTGERRGDAPSAARTMTTGRAATVLVLGAANAFTRCVCARGAVKPTGARARARHVVAACIVVAPSTVKVPPCRMEPSLFPRVDVASLAGCSISCHDSETTRLSTLTLHAHLARFWQPKVRVIRPSHRINGNRAKFVDKPARRHTGRLLFVGHLFRHDSVEASGVS